MDIIIPNKPQYLPTEVIEEILLNLPVKSLLRFSTVSKLFHSIIANPLFARKHKNRAALLRRHRLVLYSLYSLSKPDFFCSLAPISISNSSEVIMKPHYGSKRTVTPFFSCFSATNNNIDAVGEFKGKPYLLACCDELWCVQVRNSLFLWNPSMRSSVQLPPPSPSLASYSLYGLAYDSANDDYKILKIRRYPPSTPELYSLKNNCWREINSFSSHVKIPHRQKQCVFVDGRFHWIGLKTAEPPIIFSYDLSTDKYGEVAQPQYDAELSSKDYVEVVALRGMLCASVAMKARFVLWVMEEYGVEKSWTKKFDIPCHYYLRTPFYLSDNNDILVQCSTYNMWIFMYRNGEAKKKKINIACGNGSKYMSLETNALLYVESLITHKNFSAPH